mmetsp:Transcript_65423/g.165792  ORF Transcript_65423/g.165792 Transcript_65423/m.165792 type:complete len:103 (+) Transcript_65423:1015-1323(+)
MSRSRRPHSSSRLGGVGAMACKPTVVDHREVARSLAPKEFGKGGGSSSSDSSTSGGSGTPSPVNGANTPQQSPTFGFGIRLNPGLDSLQALLNPSQKKPAKA